MSCTRLLVLVAAIAAVWFSFLIVTVTPGQAASVQLSWSSPVENADHSKPLTDLAGYKIYSGQSPGNYTEVLEVGIVSSVSIGGLQVGQTYYFAVTAYDTSGNESSFSNELPITPSAQTPPPSPPPPTSSAPVAAYALNEGSGTTAADSSGNQNTLTLADATWTTSGKNGRALSFNGTGSADAANSTSLTITGNTLSVEVWVNPTTLSGATQLVSKLVQAGQHNNPYFSYSLHVRGTTPRFWVTTGGVGHTVESSVSLTTNAWTHIAGTYDGTTMKIYVNGTLTGSASATGAINGYAGPLRLAANGSGEEVWNGKIDEVRIYNRALTVSEIQTDMNTSVTPPPLGSPVAAFSGSPTSGPAPLTVQLTDTSSGSITGWSWNFGDGGTSTAQSPSHTYASAGSYTVKLTVTGPGGANTATQTSYISVDLPLPVVTFNGAPTSGAAPLTVQFTDTSSGGITGRSWDFGDNSSPSTAQNPSHTYASAGSYTVKLTVTGPGGSNTAIKANYISVNAPTQPPPVANFNGTPTAGAPPLRVQFTDTSSGSITARSWDFGDNSSPSTAQNPSHTYTAPGSYTVKLTVSGLGGSNSKVQTNYIVVSASATGLVAAYSFDAGSGTTAVDSSGNQNTLTLAGATWTTSGKNGSALAFNGTGSADATNSTSLNITGNTLSVEVWVNPTTLSGATQLVSKLVQAGQHNNPYFSYSLHVRGTTPRFWVTTNGERNTVESSAPLTTNAWTHIAGTYDGTTMKIYVNGTLTGSASATGAINGYAGPLRLAANGAEGEVWNGKIDEVRIYNRALTVSEIQTDMITAIK